MTGTVTRQDYFPYPQFVFFYPGCSKQYVDKIKHFKGFVSPFSISRYRLQLIKHNNHLEMRSSEEFL